MEAQVTARPWRCDRCCWWQFQRETKDGKVGTCHVVAVGNEGTFPQRYVNDFCPAFTPEERAPWHAELPPTA